MRAKFINEILSPNRDLFEQFKKIFFEVKDSGTNDPFYELNARLNPLNISLQDFKNHFDALPPQERAAFMNANMIPELGVRVFKYEPEQNQIQIIVDETFDDKFIYMSNNRLEHFLNFMWSAFGHETIHMEQTKRMKVKQNPSFNSHDEYFKNKQEIMALAFSFVEESRNIFNDKQILDILKGKLKPIRQPMLLKIYKDLDSESYKLFTKYVYKYLMQEKE